MTSCVVYCLWDYILKWKWHGHTRKVHTRNNSKGVFPLDHKRCHDTNCNPILGALYLIEAVIAGFRYGILTLWFEPLPSFHCRFSSDTIFWFGSIPLGRTVWQVTFWHSYMRLFPWAPPHYWPSSVGLTPGGCACGKTTLFFYTIRGPIRQVEYTTLLKNQFLKPQLRSISVETEYKWPTFAQERITADIQN